jgi:hypothetical protein
MQSVNDTLTVVVTATADTLCIGSPVTFTANIGNYNVSNLNFQWLMSSDPADLTKFDTISGAFDNTYTTNFVNDPQGITPHVAQVIVKQAGSRCVTTAVDTVFVANPRYIVTFDVDKDTICEGTQITATGILNAPIAATYTWYKNGVKVSSGVDNVYRDEPAATATNGPTMVVYGLEVEPVENCRMEAAYDTVIVYPAPSVTISGDPILCYDSNVVLVANVHGGVYPDSLNYEWRRDGVNLGVNNDTLSEKPGYSDNLYAYEVFVTNKYGCNAYDGKYLVTVNTEPKVVVTSNYDIICESGEVTFTGHLANYNYPDLLYQWYKGATADTTAANLIIGATERTLTDRVFRPDSIYTLVVRDLHSTCVAIGSDTVRFLTPYIKVVSVNSDKDFICDGGQVNVVASIEFTSPVTINGVQVTKTDGTDSLSHSFRYRWYRNGFLMPLVTGPIFSEELKSIDGDTTRYIYRVELDVPGCENVLWQGADTVTVRRNPILVIELPFASGAAHVCEYGGNVELTAWLDGEVASSSQRYTYNWYENGEAVHDGEVSNGTWSELRANHAYKLLLTRPASRTPYRYTVEHLTADGCSAISEPVEIYVHENIVVNVTADRDTVCEDGTVTLTANLNNYNEEMLTYQWSKENVEIPGATQPTFTTNVGVTAKYSVRVHALTMDASRCDAEDAITITAKPIPVIASINANVPNATMCTGGAVTVMATTTGGVSDKPYIYTWYRNGVLMEGISGNAFTDYPVAVDDDMTAYTYSATVRQDVSGCESAMTVSNAFTVYPNPRVAISGYDHVCELDSIFLIASIDTTTFRHVGPFNFVWYESGQYRDNMQYGYAANPYTNFFGELFPAKETPYSFQVEVTGANGCKSLSEPFEVTVHALPVVNVTASETEICENGTVTLTANLNDYNPDYMTFQWFTVDTVNEPDLFGNTEPTLVVAPIAGATLSTYTTSLTDTSVFRVRVAQTISGCYDESEIQINVHRLPVIDTLIIAEWDNDTATICEGEQVKITALINTTDTLGVAGGEVYTWYRNGILVENVTGNVLTDSPLAITGAITEYVYTAQVKQTASGCVSVIDPALQVVVNVYPRPTVQIAGDPIICTEPGEIKLAANVYLDTISGNYSYQWLENNAIIAGATDDTLVITKTARDYAYEFSVIVTNERGCFTASDNFLVYVNAKPVVVITANEDTVCTNGEVTFTAHLGDWNAPDMVYQWYKITSKDTTPVSGATSLTYTTTLDTTSTFSFNVTQTTSACEATSTAVTVAVIDRPVVSKPAIDNKVICDGGQVVLSTSVTNYKPAMGDITYQWYRNGVAIEGATLNTLIESPVAVDGDNTLYIYSVTAIGTKTACYSALSVADTVTVKPTPTVAVSANGNTTYCEGNTVVLTANVNPKEGTYQYQWYLDNVKMDGETAATLTTSDAARENPYNYHVVVTNLPGCSVVSDIFPVTVVADPVISVTVNHESVCEGGEVTYTATVSGGVENTNMANGWQYAWYEDNNQNDPIGTLSTLTFVPKKDVGISVKVTSPYGCFGEGRHDVTVVDDPKVTLTFEPGYDSLICQTGSTMLRATVTGGIGDNSYQWYRNGAEIAGATGQTYETGALSANTQYTVRVRQTGVDCEGYSNTKTVYIHAPYTVTVTGAPNVCEGGHVQLTAVIDNKIEGDETAYQWYRIQNGNDVKIFGANGQTYVTDTLSLANNYEYYVEITSAISGCNVKSGSVQTNVIADPTVTIHGTTEICQNDELVLTAFVNGGVAGDDYTYEWTLTNPTGTKEVTTGGDRYTKTLTATTANNQYYVTVKITRADNTGCDAISTPVAVKVRAIPEVVVTKDLNTICVGGEVTFTANVLPDVAYTYTWKNNGIIVGYGKTWTTKELVAGNSVVVEATPIASDMCPNTSDAVSVTVHADPTVTLTQIANPERCATPISFITLKVASVTSNISSNLDDYTYTWSKNGVEVTGASWDEFQQSMADAGEYTYKVRVAYNEGLGCASTWSDPVSVTVVPQPTVSIAPQANGLLDICVGGDVHLTATTADAAYNTTYGTFTYQWYASGVLQAGKTTKEYDQTNVSAPGTYNYYVVADPAGYMCNTVTSNTITVHVNADPTWKEVLVKASSTDICQGETVELLAYIEGGVTDNEGNTAGSIQWLKDGQPVSAKGGISFDIPTVDSTNAQTFIYTVRYEGMLGSGCSVADASPNAPFDAGITVHPRPTATFASDSGSTVICANDHHSVARFYLYFTGEGPWTFVLEDVTNHGTPISHTSAINPYPVDIRPAMTTTYRLTFLSDKFCEMAPNDGGAMDKYYTVEVSDVIVPDTTIVVCDATRVNGQVEVEIPIQIRSGGSNPFFDVDFVDDSQNADFTSKEIDLEPAGYFLHFNMNDAPGAYGMTITIEGCKYYVVVILPLSADRMAGAEAPLVEQRWDDVLVVNNNPAHNGGYHFVAFQWYRNGSAIDGATQQTYQEIGGLNGEYSVALTGYNKTTGELITFVTCGITYTNGEFLKVFPVPAKVNEKITIQTTFTDEELNGAVLEIFDAKGAQVNRVTQLYQTTEISGFTSPGTFVGRIITGTNEIKTVKFVIVK